MPSIFSRRRTRPDDGGPSVEQSSGGVTGQDLDIEAPDVGSWDDRVAAMEAADPEGAHRGGMTLEHPDELVPYIDITPSPLPGYTWTVGLYDEVQLFVDDDTLSEVEDDDAFESRFAAIPGITAALREDREIIHVAAVGMSAVHAHSIAVKVIADAAEAWARLDPETVAAVRDAAIAADAAAPAADDVVVAGDDAVVAVEDPPVDESPADTEP